jgi:TonB-dependent receptor
VIVDDSSLPGGGYNPDNIVSDLYQARGYEMENNIQQVHLSGAWENVGDGGLRAINFGVASTRYDMDTYRSGTFSFVNVPLDSLDLRFEPIGDTADQFPGTDMLYPLIPKYNVFQFLDIVKQEGRFFLNPPVVNGVEEDTLAAYMSFDVEGEFNGLMFDINAGVRWEDTDVTAYSLQNGFIALNYRHPEELQPIFANEATNQELEGGYTKILPNFDFRLDLTDDLVARFSYSRTMSRASISAMFPSTNLNAPRPGDPARASQGNPNLLPLESDNFDLSLEWYYGESSYASVGYFKKYVEDFIGSSVEFRTIADVNGNPLTDPSVNPRPGCPDITEPFNPDCLGTASDPVITWEVSTPGNLDNSEVEGWELNIQHMFGDTGFGGIVNATFVDSDAELDLFDFSQTLALTGLSDSYNIVGFWENETFQVRVAYNWRDDFLLGLGAEPVFTEDYGQFDISASWNFHDNFSLYFEGLNVTDETTRRHARFREQLLDAEQYGPRYTLGVRGRW